MSEYPKWVQRDPNVGAVLCLNKGEEDKLLADWEAEGKHKADAEAKAAMEAKNAQEQELRTAEKKAR